MKYPFEFKELPLTDKMLDKLGFTEYHDGSGDSGDRRFGKYKLWSIDEKDDSADGYGSWAPEYSAKYFCSDHRAVQFRSIYFLHDLYEDIKINNPEELDAFIEKTKRVNMYPFIKSYLEFKNNNQ